MFQLISPNLNVDYMGKRFIWIGLSIVMILGAIVLFFTKGLNYGIDFTGGAEVHIKVPAEWDIGKTRTVMDAVLPGAKIQQIGEQAQNEYLVRAQGDESTVQKVGQQVEETLKKNFPNGGYEMLRVDVVGPAAGGLLRKKGFWSMFYALLAILLYVALRFDTRYAPGAVLALFHDTVITIGIFIVFEIPFDLTVLAALLALIGYSNNDTIIVFDRVRETRHMYPDKKIEDLVNLAINHTLGRTIMTALTTFLVVVALYVLGGPVIHGFAFTLMVGIVVGTYSSIFIASSLLVALTHYQDKTLGNSVKTSPSRMGGKARAASGDARV